MDEMDQIMEQVGETSWVNPDSVVAVVWDDYTEAMPMLLLNSGHGVRADHYSLPDSDRTVENRQKKCNELMAYLGLVQ